MVRPRYLIVAAGVLGLLVFAVAVLKGRGSPSAESLQTRSYAAPILQARDIYLNTQGITQPGNAIWTLGFQPRPDREPWTVQLPIEWGADPFKDQNWQFQLHAWRIIDPVLRGYLKDGATRTESFKTAVLIARDWAHWHQSNAARFSWNDMATGIRAMRLAFLLDHMFAGRENADADVRSALVHLALKHVAALFDPSKITQSNHGIFQIHGLRVLCEVLGQIAECDGAAVFADRQMLRLLDQQFTPAGTHSEHSPDYHRFAMGMFKTFVTSRWYAVATTIADRLKNAKAVYASFVFPDGRVARIGDSSGTAPVPKAAPSGACKTLMSRPDATSASHASRELPAACIETADLTSGGYAVVRTRPEVGKDLSAMLVVTATYNDANHKHSDDLSFELFEAGEMLFADSGKYAYLDDAMRSYVTSLNAHNTVGLADRQMGVADTLPYGPTALRRMAKTDDGYLIEGHVTRKPFTHRRQLLYRPGRYLVIVDDLKASVPQVYAQYFTLTARIPEPSAAGRRVTIAHTRERTATLDVLSQDCSISLARGATSPQIQGWESNGYRHMVPATTIKVACPGTERTIQTVIAFDEEAGGLARSAAARLGSSWP